ncbi:MAG TPA: RNA polymerase subunit sigma-24 [Opitutae bacterium]|nr:RNA polymerase subunit sigma-24 [Opitutae bacterium]|tara:strand:- start:235 stop:834 length:600 start_codon:yes stop_codon:yes gene_type:complete
MSKEQALVQRLKLGEESAFEELMLEYWDLIFNRAMQLLGNRQDAEEVTQDTFLKAREGITKFRGDAAISTWIYQIVTNLSRNRYWYWFRRRRGQSYSIDAQVTNQEDGNTTFAEMLESRDVCPVEATISQELKEDIMAAAQELSNDHRIILRHIYLADMSYEEIAEELGITVGTVKSRVARARENLRALVRKRRANMIA